MSSGRGRRSCDRSSSLAAVCQQLLQHAAQGLHACRVVLAELGLELVMQPADELFSGLLMGCKTALEGGQALVQVSAKIVGAALQLLLEGVELRMNVAHSLGLLHNRAVLLAQLGFHVLDKVREPVLEVGGADSLAAQVADVAAQGGLHGVHVHAQEIEGLAQVRGKALLSQEGRVQQVGGADC